MKPRTGYGLPLFVVLTMAVGIVVLGDRPPTVVPIEEEALVDRSFTERASRSGDREDARRLEELNEVATQEAAGWARFFAEAEQQKTAAEVLAAQEAQRAAQREEARRRAERNRRAIARRQAQASQQAPSSGATGASGVLACIRRYEGAYTTNTGNGYYGAYQFDLRTWGGDPDRRTGLRSAGAVTRAGYGGWANHLPSQAPPHVQDAAAAQLFRERALQPWGAKARANCAGMTL